MSYNELAKLEVLSAINSINSVAELQAFKDVIARFFAQRAQQGIDALWENGKITPDTIEAWGEEHMRTPYRHAANRS